MADNENIEHDDDLTDEERNWKRLREKAEAAEKRNSELEAQLKELRVVQAGISKDSPLFKAALKAEDDEELQALAGLAKGATASQETTETDVDNTPSFSQEDVESTDLRRATATGAKPDVSPEVDVYAEAKQAYDKGLASGDGQDAALAKYVSHVNYAGQSRDPKLSSQVDWHTNWQKHQQQAIVDMQWLASRD